MGDTTISSWTHANRSIRAAHRTWLEHHTRHVGRIGALAVALGIGVTAFDPTGLAWATPEDGTTTQSDGGQPSQDSSPAHGPANDPPATSPTDGTSSSQATAHVGAPSAPTVSISSEGGANTSINGQSAGGQTGTGQASTAHAGTAHASTDTPASASPSAPPPAPPSAEPTAPVGTTAAAAPPSAPPPAPAPPITAAPSGSAGHALPGPPAQRWLGGGVRPAPPPPRPGGAAIAPPGPPVRALDLTTTVTADSAGARPAAVVSSTASQAVTAPATSGGTVLSIVARAGVALLAPFLTPGTGSPAAPPLVWTVLAWIRREFDDAVSAVSGQAHLGGPSAGPTAYRGVTGDVTVYGHRSATVTFGGGGSTATHTTYSADLPPRGEVTTLATVDTVTARQTGDGQDIAGRWLPGGTVVSPDGAFTVQATTLGPLAHATRLTVIDNALGRKAGQTTVVRGRIVDLAASPCGTTVVSDGFDPVTGATATRLTVLDTARGARIGDVVELAGRVRLPLAVSPDGSRLLLSVDRDGSPGTRAAVVDVGAGRRVGPVVELDGDAGPGAWSADGTRAAFATSVRDGGSADTHVHLLDAAGNVTGPPIVLAGQSIRDVAFTPDGSGLTVVTYSAASGVTRLAVADAASGVLLGDPVELDGRPSAVGHDASGGRIAVATHTPGAAAVGHVLRLVVMNTSGGAPAGPVTTMATAAPSRVSFVRDLDGAVITTTIDGAEPVTTVTVVDLARGKRIGDGVTVDGIEDHTVTSPDGAVVAVTAYLRDPRTGTATTTLTLIDAESGTTIGEPHAVAGTPAGTLFSPGGTRVVQTAEDAATQGILTRAVVVDTAVGTTVGGTLVLDGRSVGTVFSPDDSRMTLTGHVHHDDTDVTSTRFVTVSVA